MGCSIPIKKLSPEGFLPNVFISPPTSTKAASAPLDFRESIIISTECPWAKLIKFN